MTSQSPASQIQNLLKSPIKLAAMTAALKLSDFETQCYDYFSYPIGLKLHCLKKENTASVPESFSALFLADLYDDNLWIDEESRRTREDQFVIEEIETSQWQEALLQIHIPQYFRLTKEPDVKIWDSSDFTKKFLYWRPENLPESEFSHISSLLKDIVWVVNLSPGSFYEKFFGETKEHYFIAESGVYD